MKERERVNDAGADDDDDVDDENRRSKKPQLHLIVTLKDDIVAFAYSDVGIIF